MPHSLAQIYVHLVFSTKQREPLLKDKGLRTETHAYLAGICRNYDSPPLIVGGVEDHVHLLFSLSRTHTVAEVVRELKRESSKWLKVQDPSLHAFYWQGGYGIFSISPAHVPAVTQYIARQEEHHQQVSYQDEFRRLLKKYHIEFDERFVWD